MRKTWVGILIFGLWLLWPQQSSLGDQTSLGDDEPLPQFSLPADIMTVQLKSERWTYRLYEDGTVKKVVERLPLSSKR